MFYLKTKKMSVFILVSFIQFGLYLSKFFHEKTYNYKNHEEHLNENTDNSRKLSAKHCSGKLA